MFAKVVRFFTGSGRDWTAAVVTLLSVAQLNVTAAIAADDPTIGSFRTWVTNLAWSPDGNTLATVGGQTLLYRPGEVKLWDPMSGKLRATLSGHEAAVWCVAFSQDGKTLATGGYDGQVKLWNPTDGKSLASFEAHKHWVHALAFSPDGKLLATGSEDATIKLWDLSTTPPQEKKTLTGHTAGITSVAFVDAGRIVSGSVDRTAALWSVGDGQLQGKFEGHADAVLSVAVLDGKSVATSSADRLIKLWTLEGPKLAEAAKAKAAFDAAAVEAAKKAEADKKAAEEAAKKAEAKKDDAKKAELKQAAPTEETPPPVFRSPAEIASLPGHKNWVGSISVSRDGKLLVSTSHDRTVRIWSLADRKEAAQFEGFQGSVWCAAFAPNGQALAVGSHSDSLRLWNMADKTERFPTKKP